MSDASLAAELIRDVAGPRGPDEPKKALWFKAHQRLSRINERWTLRRVRALWGSEAARIEHREIKEMERAIAERHALQEARREHYDFIAETERLAAACTARDEAFYRPEIEARRGVIGGMYRAGARRSGQGPAE